MRNIFSTPSAEMLALRELEEAKRRLLEAYSYREEADCRVACYAERINRLTEYLRNVQEEIA
jgi:hypothetical protein|tara:strand:+ start:393 stop:578 length:186 start_codon:yes stop_codon:yes gene_type:complete